VLRLDNDYDGAAQALREAVALSRATGDSHDDVEALCELALLRREEGRLREAAATCRDALQRAEDYVRQTGQRMPIAACAHVYLSVMLREWNEVDEALRHVREGLDLCRRWGQLDMEATAYISLSAALQAAGDLPGSLAAIEKAKQLVRNYSSTYTLYAGAYEAHTYLAQGDVKAAARWAEQFNLRPDDEISVQYKRIYVVFARVLVAQGRLDEALALLAKLQDAAEETKATGYLIEILVVRAMTLRALSRMDDAIAALKRALTLAEPEGYVRTFVDQGEPMAALLRMAAARGIAVDYVNKLLVALKAESRIRGGQLAAPSTVASLPEPLSERELQVLRLLPTSLSGQEIADELCIAESTVRSHIKSIYGKLNVHRRNEAVERAKELDLT